MNLSTRAQPGDLSLENIIIGMLRCRMSVVRKRERKEKVLAFGPILSTRTPVRGARMYNIKIDTEPSQDISDSDLSCSMFAL